jgi:hypothetical protein
MRGRRHWERGQAGRQVLLRVTPKGGGPARDVIVQPVSAQAEDGLRYDEWEYTRRLAVEKAGQNQVGYVHLRAMGAGNMAEWMREFYPVFNRPGLIVVDNLPHETFGGKDAQLDDAVRHLQDLIKSTPIPVPPPPPDPSSYPPTKFESLVLTTLLKMEPKV